MNELSIDVVIEEFQVHIAILEMIYDIHFRGPIIVLI